jgi:Wiskott-Aldrich syndrome protein
MNDDVDMDAPQISILREEETPPPQLPTPSRSKFRVNLLVGEKKGTNPPSVSGSRKPGVESDQEDDEEHDELEEDQLIDDVDDGVQVKRPLSVTLPAPAPKAKPNPKKRSRKEPILGDGWDPLHNASMSDSLAIKLPPKKKAAPKKPVASTKSKSKAVPKVVKNLAISHLEDTGVLSETYTGTAASSPAPHDANSPEPEIPGPSASTSDMNINSMPLPIYPLPSKPFPVQPPPKIPTGFAPVIPLDKSTNRPRRWRTAQREIRGIAGGRWFARSWVGEKDSELATASANAAAAAAILKANIEADKRAGLGSTSAGAPLSTVSASSPSPAKGLAKPKGPKIQSGVSLGPSRAASIASDAHAPRPPTKMRTMLVGPSSEAGNDSDMTAPVP